MILKLLVVLAGVSHIHSLPFYRKDYIYNGDRDAFYKLIWTPYSVTYDSAVTTCDNEGAQLFYPKDADEWRVIKSLQDTLTLERYHVTANKSAVLVGIYNINGQYISVDGLPITVKDDGGSGDCVTMDLNTGIVSTCKANTDPKLFACKKSYQERCPTIDLGYKYNTETRKCYKFNKRKVTWYDAVSECTLEGGLLAVVEDSLEAEQLRRLLQTPLFSPNMQYHSGFRKLGETYYTLKGKKLEDSYMYQMDEPETRLEQQRNYREPQRYYNEYGNVDTEEIDPKQPPMPPVPVTKNCGVIEYSIQYSGQLLTKSTECSELRPFVCEMKAKF